jgi:hypothetical protein
MALSADFRSEKRVFFAYLLRQLRRLHLRLDDLQSNNVSSGLAAIISFCAVADGETAFSERRASRIVNARRLGDNWGRRLSVDGRHGRCRWPRMHKSCACLRWAISKDGRVVGVEFTAARLPSPLPRATTPLQKRSVAFGLLQARSMDSELRRPARVKMTYLRPRSRIVNYQTVIL